jgi:ribosomal protein S18 acetylase RimI-like enzyme
MAHAIAGNRQLERIDIVNFAYEPMAAAARSAQIYHELITECVALSCGVAHYSTRYPELIEANQLREAVIPERTASSTAFDEVQAFYTERNLTCRYWVPAESQAIEPVEALLLDRGFTRCEANIMAYRDPATIDPNPNVRILPARAMREALRTLCLQDERRTDSVRPMLAEATDQRMDDPRYDLFVAMCEGEPAGRGALLQAGQIGRIADFHIAETYRGQGVDRTLLRHLLMMSQRLALNITVMEVEPAEYDTIAMLNQCGFVTTGTSVGFRAGSPEA